jgi:hypothetical protein
MKSAWKRHTTYRAGDGCKANLFNVATVNRQRCRKKKKKKKKKKSSAALPDGEERAEKNHRIGLNSPTPTKSLIEARCSKQNSSLRRPKSSDLYIFFIHLYYRLVDLSDRLFIRYFVDTL